MRASATIHDINRGATRELPIQTGWHAATRAASPSDHPLRATRRPGVVYFETARVQELAGLAEAAYAISSLQALIGGVNDVQIFGFLMSRMDAVGWFAVGCRETAGDRAVSLQPSAPGHSGAGWRADAATYDAHDCNHRTGLKPVRSHLIWHVVLLIARLGPIANRPILPQRGGQQALHLAIQPPHVHHAPEEPRECRAGFEGPTTALLSLALNLLPSHRIMTSPQSIVAQSGPTARKLPGIQGAGMATHLCLLAGRNRTKFCTSQLGHGKTQRSA